MQHLYRAYRPSTLLNTEVHLLPGVGGRDAEESQAASVRVLIPRACAVL